VGEAEKPPHLGEAAQDLVDRLMHPPLPVRRTLVGQLQQEPLCPVQLGKRPILLNNKCRVLSQRFTPGF
jgi:hypothetical protein